MNFSKFVSHRTHKFWLKITAIIVGSFGPVFFLGTMVQTMEPARLSLDILTWPIDGSITFASPETRFLSAITGGFLLGWGVMIWLLSIWIYDKAPNATRKIVLISLLSWFFLDSAGSITSGNAVNAFINVIVLLLAVGPLWFGVKD